MRIFYEVCREHGIESNPNRNFDYLHIFEDKLAGEQLSLF